MNFTASRQVTELCKIHLDLHTPDWDPEILSRVDPEQIARTLSGAGIRVLYFFAKDHYGNAYYNTKLGHKHACLGDRDLLAEMIEVGRKHDIQIVAYYSAFQDNHIAELHPEWRIKTEPQPPRGNWLFVCPNVADYRSYCQQMIAEVASTYDVNGFHVDMLNYDFNLPSCYCDACRTQFRELHGAELPVDATDPELWAKFLAFRYRSVERYAEEMRAAIKRERPDLPVVFNYHGSPGFDWRVGQLPVRHARYSDVGTGETYLPLFGAVYPGMETRFVRNLVPGRPFEMVPWRMNRITDFTLKPLQQMRWEAFVSLAGGGSLMMIDQPFHDGWLDEVPYGAIRELTQEIAQKAGTFRGTHLRHVGMYYSSKTRDHYRPEKLAEFLMPLVGAYKGLIESHFLIDFIFDETVTRAILDQYAVIVLPNVTILDEAETALLREWVASGGTLIASHHTSLYDDRGGRLPNFGLANVFGVDFINERDTDSTFVTQIEGPLGRDIPPALHVLNLGPCMHVGLKTAIEHGSLRQSFRKQQFPDRFFSHGIHPPAERVAAAAYVNRFGLGQSIYFPFQVDASYANTNELPEHRLMLRNAALMSDIHQLVQLDAPVNVEMEVLRQEHGLIIHLLAFNQVRQAVTLPSLNLPIRPSPRMEETVMYRATITCAQPVRACRSLAGTVIRRLSEHAFEVIVRDLHETIEVQLQEA